jgi:hypothetical protein
MARRLTLLRAGKWVAVIACLIFPSLWAVSVAQRDFGHATTHTVIFLSRGCIFIQIDEWGSYPRDWYWRPYTPMRGESRMDAILDAARPKWPSGASVSGMLSLMLPLWIPIAASGCVALVLSRRARDKKAVAAATGAGSAAAGRRIAHSTAFKLIALICMAAITIPRFAEILRPAGAARSPWPSCALLLLAAGLGVIGARARSWGITAAGVACFVLSLELPGLVAYRHWMPLSFALFAGTALLIALMAHAVASALTATSTPGFCSVCAYDLTGNTSGTCPECGTKIPAGRAVASSAY